MTAPRRSPCDTSDAVRKPGSGPAGGEGEGVLTDQYRIERHKRPVNVLFLDGRVEHVPLESLWKLKWSETFEQRDVSIPRG